MNEQSNLYLLLSLPVQIASLPPHAGAGKHSIMTYGTCIMLLTPILHDS
jgi:hypothetical protein